MVFLITLTAGLKAIMGAISSFVRDKLVYSTCFILWLNYMYESVNHYNANYQWLTLATKIIIRISSSNGNRNGGLNVSINVSNRDSG